jgi:hypothetical protein
MSVFNPNNFDILIDDISTDILTDIGKKIGGFNVSGGVIEAKKYLSIDCSGSILFEALNAKSLDIDLNGIAKAKIAGYEKNLSFNIQSNIMVPDLEQLLLSKNKPINLKIEIDEKLSLRGIILDVLLKINNSFKVDLLFKNIVYKIYKVVDDEEFLIGEKNQEEDILVEAGKNKGSTCNILIPFSNFLPLRLSTDGFMMKVYARISIKGVTQSVFLELTGYIDIHPFR